MAKYSKSQVTEAMEHLKTYIKPGDTLHTIVTHVSRSGMSRSIRVLSLKNDERLDLTYMVARVLDESIDQRNEGLKVSGCGMDMGFEVVYRLSYAMFPDGFTCTGDKCPSNDHVNGDRDYSPHLHKSGGYALKQRWL